MRPALERSSRVLASLVLLRTRASREFVWVSLAQGTALVGGLVTIKLLTNLLSPESYGKFALALTIAGALGTLVYGPMSQVALRFSSIAGAAEQLVVLVAWLQRKYTVAFWTIAGTAVGGAALAFGLAGREWLWLVLGAACLGLAAGANSVMCALLNGMRRRREMALLQIAETAGKAALAVAAVAVVARTSQAALFGSALATAVVALAFYRYLRKRAPAGPGGAAPEPSTSEQQHLASRMTRYMVPFVLFAAIGMAGVYGDRWMIQARLGAADVGMYAAMYQIANAPVVVLLSLLNQFALPIVYETVGGAEGGRDPGKANPYGYFLAVSIVVIAAVSLLAYWFGEWILSFFASSGYAVYHRSFWLVVLGVALFNLGQQLSIKGMILVRPGIYMLPKLIHSAGLLALALAWGQDVHGVCLAVAVAAALYYLSILTANTVAGRHERSTRTAT